MPDFGSPNAKDATAYYEEIAKEVTEDLKNFVDNVGPEVANRALGTEEKTKPEQYTDWALRDDGYWENQFRILRSAGVSFEDSLMEMVKHDRVMREFHEKRRNGSKQ